MRGVFVFCACHRPQKWVQPYTRSARPAALLVSEVEADICRNPLQAQIQAVGFVVGTKLGVPGLELLGIGSVTGRLRLENKGGKV